MNDIPEKTARDFIDGYRSSDERFIRFQWNGRHAADFIDENLAFREAVKKLVLESLDSAPLELIRDLYRAETQFSREAWGIDGRVGRLAEHLLRQGNDRFIEDYIEGKYQSFDASLGTAFEVDLPLAEHLLQVVRERLQVATNTDEERVRLLRLGEETFQSWITGSKRVTCSQPNSTALTRVPTAPLQLGELDAEVPQPSPGPLGVALSSLGVATLRPGDLPHRFLQQSLLRSA